MSDLSRRAEEILDVASAPGANPHGTVMVLDRLGSLRVMSHEGWTLPGLIQEFGAREVYRITKRAGKITVDGWSAAQQCSISRPYAAMSQVMPLLAASLNDREPRVWNS